MEDMAFVLSFNNEKSVSSELSADPLFLDPTSQLPYVTRPDATRWSEEKNVDPTKPNEPRPQ